MISASIGMAMLRLAWQKGAVHYLWAQPMQQRRDRAGAGRPRTTRGLFRLSRPVRWNVGGNVGGLPG